MKASTFTDPFVCLVQAVRAFDAVLKVDAKNVRALVGLATSRAVQSNVSSFTVRVVSSFTVGVVSISPVSHPL